MRLRSLLFVASALCALWFVLIGCTSAQDELDEGVAEREAPSGGKGATPLAQYPGAPHEARNGDLWFATVLQGLIRYDGKKFVSLSTKDGLAGRGVRDILELENGHFWFGTTGGVSVYDGETFRTLTDYGNLAITRTFSEPGDHRDIWDIHQDRKGQFWIATMGGVFRYEGTSFVPFPLAATATEGKWEFTPKMVYSIFEDRAGNIWFGTDGAGAIRYDGKTQEVFTAKDHGLCSDRVCTIYQDSRGDYWFGTSDGGVSRYDGEQFTTHLRSAEHSIHTGWGRFMSIVEDNQGSVWFGVCSQGGGVHRFDGETFRYYSEKEGLGNGGVPSIRADRSGALWFGTTAGVYRFDGERFHHFGK